MSTLDELLHEVIEHRAAADMIRVLHTDSVAGFCPTCFRAADVSDTDDGLVAWPCPTLQILGFAPTDLAEAGPAAAPTLEHDA